ALSSHAPPGALAAICATKPRQHGDAIAIFPLLNGCFIYVQMAAGALLGSAEFKVVVRNAEYGERGKAERQRVRLIHAHADSHSRSTTVLEGWQSGQTPCRER
ncbi:hypothetical protein, partial [Caldimonas tepidiphila]|uniref:hypothetical protein n=1 Tax=Caldimonas tepidiphila TaxID=2315841 RepID=UPI00196B0591